MSMGTIARIVRESYEAHQANVQKESGRHYVFRSRWYWIVLFLLWIPVLRQRYFRVYKRKKDEVGSIVARYADVILEGLHEWQDGLRRCEYEGAFLFVTEQSLNVQRQGRDSVIEASQNMICGIRSVGTSGYFRGIKSPGGLRTNPDNGLLSNDVAVAYMQQLIEAFPAPA